MLLIKDLGMQPYGDVWERMKAFTQNRTTTTDDELWLLEHYPVYTQGQAGKAEHILEPKNIPIIQTDRGGQVTYHGPGQLIAYPLINLASRNLNIKTLVCGLEKIIIQTLEEFKIVGSQCSGAPGVYILNKKIASIGLRIKHGYSYHGIALNIAMDLEPFQRINPCGFTQLEMTQIHDYDKTISLDVAKTAFINNFKTYFGY